MKIFYFPVLIISLVLLPEFSFAFHCSFNSSAWGLRNTVLLEYEHNKYIHLHDSRIQLSTNRQDKFSFVHIHFQGYLMEEDKSKYVDVFMDSLKYYTYSSNTNGCTVTFYESDNDSLLIDSNNNRVNLNEAEKAIIHRLAESCVRSDLCGVGNFKVDRDGDLSFESVQSTINYFVDTSFPGMLSAFLLNHEGGLRFSLNSMPVNIWKFTLYLNDFLVEGIDTIQRTDDVYIANENNVYTVQFGFRFPKLAISSDNIVLWSGKNIGRIEIKGFSFISTITIDLKSTNCSIKLSDFRIVSYKNIDISLKLGGIFPVSYSGDRSTFGDVEKSAIAAANEFARTEMIDCQQYLNQLSDVFKNVL
ncbi:hypothetical protein TSAR_001254 [Trichomalopsis sarcophagae]|uniref:Lipid-binding serum glycoprotein N-terminal domain-containing protein n=1 Tax=Trichomalopsis sarcophagae TaxID=543379 RepID=A0A232F741_9HYME|nr:hypothetical protein TSAR_001254 [Trichomalopsis sarcophagae]